MKFNRRARLDTSQISDRRRMGRGGTIAAGGGIGAIAILLLAMCTGANPAPTVSITAPANNTHFTAPAAFTIAATAADTAPGTVSKVEFYRDGLLLGSDTAAPYTWDVSNLYSTGEVTSHRRCGACRRLQSEWRGRCRGLCRVA